MSQDTYDAVQAALLNSQMEPRSEIITAFVDVLTFAQNEGDGREQSQMRGLFEEALAKLLQMNGRPPQEGDEK